MIENEFKVMLDKDGYEKLLKLYSFETVEQTNHYYDTDGLTMSEKRITVRVRELDGKCFLQLKLPTGITHSRVELSEETDGVPETISSGTLKALAGEYSLGEVEFSDVKRLGALKTTRSVHRFSGGEIDLDKSEYFGRIDYEVEIEFTDENAARTVLNEITQKLGISPDSDVCTGKIHRFMEEWRKTR